MGQNGRQITRLGPLLTAILGLGFLASSAWLGLLMPRTGFSSAPPGTLWTRDQLVAALDTWKVKALLLTADHDSDVVARTIADELVVYRASPRDPAQLGSAQALAEIQAHIPDDVLAAGRTDGGLAAYGRAVAQIAPPNAAIAVLTWWISLLAGLSIVMYRAAGRTPFRFSAPFGPFGVGTNHSP